MLGSMIISVLVVQFADFGVLSNLLTSFEYADPQLFDVLILQHAIFLPTSF